MSPIDIEKIAIHNDDMPSNLNPAEQLLFLSFRFLYASYRAGTITREQAKKEKQSILNRFEQMQRWAKIYQDTCRVWCELAGISKEVESGDCDRCKQIMRILDGRITFNCQYCKGNDTKG